MKQILIQSFFLAIVFWCIRKVSANFLKIFIFNVPDGQTDRMTTPPPPVGGGRGGGEPGRSTWYQPRRYFRSPPHDVITACKQRQNPHAYKGHTVIKSRVCVGPCRHAKSLFSALIQVHTTRAGVPIPRKSGVSDKTSSLFYLYLPRRDNIYRFHKLLVKRTVARDFCS